MNLTDPTADYCRNLIEVTENLIKVQVDFWYSLFQKMGEPKADAIWMAIETVQDEFDKCDFGVNFDGPMEVA